MDDQAAILARRVALAASAWFNAPADVEAYRRLAAAVGEWNTYAAPQLVDDDLLDELADQHPPTPLGDAVPDLEAALRRAARRML
ncbi:hypothetical protein [Nocardioides sp. GXZ039]|uniref:hypothetical protein n=1 Tax=Nocardioides sp. GXZ039 TaxID=3136018 RepID=UPI0030F491FC